MPHINSKSSSDGVRRVSFQRYPKFTIVFGSKFTDEVYHQQNKHSTKLSRSLPKTDMLNLDV